MTADSRHYTGPGALGATPLPGRNAAGVPPTPGAGAVGADTNQIETMTEAEHAAQFMALARSATATAGPTNFGAITNAAVTQTADVFAAYNKLEVLRLVNGVTVLYGDILIP